MPIWQSVGCHFDSWSAAEVVIFSSEHAERAKTESDALPHISRSANPTSILTELWRIPWQIHKETCDNRQTWNFVRLRCVFCQPSRRHNRCVERAGLGPGQGAVGPGLQGRTAGPPAGQARAAGPGDPRPPEAPRPSPRPTSPTASRRWPASMPSGINSGRSTCSSPTPASACPTQLEPLNVEQVENMLKVIPWAWSTRSRPCCPDVRARHRPSVGLCPAWPRSRDCRANRATVPARRP